MVYLKSLVSGHKATFIKPRIAQEKIEVYRWDPYSKCATHDAFGLNERGLNESLSFVLDNKLDLTEIDLLRIKLSYSSLFKCFRGCPISILGSTH